MTGPPPADLAEEESADTLCLGCRKLAVLKCRANEVALTLSLEEEHLEVEASLKQLASFAKKERRGVRALATAALARSSQLSRSSEAKLQAIDSWL